MKDDLVFDVDDDYFGSYFNWCNYYGKKDKARRFLYKRLHIIYFNYFSKFCSDVSFESMKKKKFKNSLSLYVH